MFLKKNLRYHVYVRPLYIYVELPIITKCTPYDLIPEIIDQWSIISVNFFLQIKSSISIQSKYIPYNYKNLHKMKLKTLRLVLGRGVSIPFAATVVFLGVSPKMKSQQSREFE